MFCVRKAAGGCCGIIQGGGTVWVLSICLGWDVSLAKCRKRGSAGLECHENTEDLHMILVCFTDRDVAAGMSTCRRSKSARRKTVGHSARRHAQRCASRESRKLTARPHTTPSATRTVSAAPRCKSCMYAQQLPVLPLPSNHSATVSLLPMGLHARVYQNCYVVCKGGACSKHAPPSCPHVQNVPTARARPAVATGCKDGAVEKAAVRQK